MAGGFRPRPLIVDTAVAEHLETPSFMRAAAQCAPTLRPPLMKLGATARDFQRPQATKQGMQTDENANESAQDRRFQILFDLIWLDDWCNVDAGLVDLRPPAAPTSPPGFVPELWTVGVLALVSPRPEAA
jgi:hypothetical protein